MKILITEKQTIPEGAHEGAITRIEYRDTPYNYTDVVIALIINEKSIDLKAGYPTAISEESSLGKLLARFGATLMPDTEIDPADFLVGKLCKFITTADGQFSKVMPESVKPSEHKQA